MNNPHLNRAVFVFSFLGVFVAGYLWYMHGHAADIPCGSSHGCETVALSRYSRFPFGAGPPVAAWGTVGYLALTVLAFLRTLNERPSRDRVLLSLVAVGSTFAALASLYLTYLEVFHLHAICRWCVGSQIIILVVCVLSVADWLAQSAAAGRAKGVAV